MQFELDDKKSSLNKDKHGIDFAEAQALWEDERYVKAPSKYPDEERYIVIGLIDGKHYSAIITLRGENIRIISVRQARKEEVEFYEG